MIVYHVASNPIIGRAKNKKNITIDYVLTIPYTEFINGNQLQASNSLHSGKALLLKGSVFNNLISRNRF